MEMPEVDTAPTGYVKVFERVEGAVLRGRVDGAEEVSLACTMGMNRGRRFEYGRRVKVQDGNFELVVPYAQDTAYPVKPVTPYRLRAGDVTKEIALSDEDLDGRIVTVDLSAGRMEKQPFSGGGRPHVLSWRAPSLRRIADVPFPLFS